MKMALVLLTAVFVTFSFFNTTRAANQSDILINEIAWMGSVNSANDEWIELFNATELSLNLDGWVLRSADEKLKINLKGVIQPGAFYLLERTDDNSVPGIKADLIYSGVLVNSGMDLKLYDISGNLIDQANYSAGWPSGNNAGKQTMERTSSFGWQTSREDSGTPGLKNSLGLSPIKEAPEIESYPIGVFINEVLPAPDGPDETDEWIELYNSNNFIVDLGGWKIKDLEGSTTTYILPENTKVPTGNYLLLKRPEIKITLNDKNDGLNLMWPNGKIVDSMNYVDAPKNQSYNKIHPSGWEWSPKLSPGSLNILPEEKTLPESKKLDTKQLAATGESVNFRSKNGSPWFLFLVAIVLTVVSALTILILKFKFKKPI